VPASVLVTFVVCNQLLVLCHHTLQLNSFLHGTFLVVICWCFSTYGSWGLKAIRYDIVLMHSGVLGVSWIEPHAVDINCDNTISTGSGYWISVWVSHCVILCQ